MDLNQFIIFKYFEFRWDYSKYVIFAIVPKLLNLFFKFNYFELEYSKNLLHFYILFSKILYWI
jgi:hypothetical protein